MWQRAKPKSLRLLHHELAVALVVLACKVHSCFMSRLCAQNCIVVVSDFSLGLLLGREDHLPSCRYHPPLITATQLLPLYRCRLRVGIFNHAHGAVLHQTAALSFSNFLVSNTGIALRWTPLASRRTSIGWCGCTDLAVAIPLWSSLSSGELTLTCRP